ncbi:polysaccharide deacetylase family protein [Bradyrhizobium sp.]|uniref:polysaccharide deacetylase family protein n=1 Tax=Bradyrhizobium sp. TaxID=376 RepID=UPI0026231F3B|nr:polysaccharide deacetylase family protein [Bradyrhizobium sp.]
MKQLRSNVIRAGLEAISFTGAHRLFRPIFAGVGSIFMLHHVRPPREAAFQPNSHLEVTPKFLRATLAHLRAHGVDIITMDELLRRLAGRDFSRRFACFTFDDGYRDNRDFALPVMREFDAPFTVYVTSDFAEGTGNLWWVALEHLIAKASHIEAVIDGAAVRIDSSTLSAKRAAFERLHDWLRALPSRNDVAREVGALCTRHGIDPAEICRDLCLSWDELKPFAAEVLVSIGAHTLTHCNLAHEPSEIASEEIATSRSRIEDALQRPVRHFAYPYGDKAAAGKREFELTKAAGFQSAVTTRPGMIFPENAGYPTALPRVSLNGNFQNEWILPVLTSGAVCAVRNGFRRIDAV